MQEDGSFVMKSFVQTQNISESTVAALADNKREGIFQCSDCGEVQTSFLAMRLMCSCGRQNPLDNVSYESDVSSEVYYLEEEEY